jgi:uncharacterized protein
MLITFRVSNFLSFNDEAELSMQAGPQRNLPSHYISTGSGRNDVNILKTAVIYGANASGKSNLIKAMDFAKKVIVNGIKSETNISASTLQIGKNYPRLNLNSNWMKRCMPTAFLPI